MRLLTIALTGLLVASNACAGWLTFGGKIHSDTTDTVTGVQSQKLVNVELGLANEAALRAGGDVVAMTNYVAALTAEAQARAAGDAVAMTNWQARVNALTNGAALGETALQPSWAATGTVFRATEVTGAQSTLIETAWQNPAAAADWTWTSNGREITLTGYSGPDAVVIPDMLDGLPVTGFGEVFRGNMDITSIGGGANIKEIGYHAFYYCEGLISISLPACTTVGYEALEGCVALTYVSLPACTTVGDEAFLGCGALNSVPLPACTTVGIAAFLGCVSLSTVPLPACTTVGNYAFYACENLNSVTFGQNAPAPAADVFWQSTPTIYVSNPHATGWGDTWNGRPVVRLPLYGSSVTAQAYTLNGDTITEWPEGGGETSIIAPLYESGTNVTVTSTQSVYSVAVTGAGPVGIDWSGLALDGTGRAEVTLRLNVTEWGGTNVTFSPSLTFDRTPEILVTGVWEFAASTIDGVTTRVRQTWPETGAWTHMMRTYGSAGDTVGTWAAFAGGGSTNRAYFNLPNTGLHYVRMRPRTAANGMAGTYWLVPLVQGNGAINLATAVDTNVFGPVSSGYRIALDGVIDGSTGVALVGTHTPSYGVDALYRDCLCRPLNANERAAYAAGWRP